MIDNKSNQTFLCSITLVFRYCTLRTVYSVKQIIAPEYSMFKLAYDHNCA